MSGGTVHAGWRGNQPYLGWTIQATVLALHSAGRDEGRDHVPLYFSLQHHFKFILTFPSSVRAQIAYERLRDRSIKTFCQLWSSWAPRQNHSFRPHTLLRTYLLAAFSLFPRDGANVTPPTWLDDTGKSLLFLLCSQSILYIN